MKRLTTLFLLVLVLGSQALYAAEKGNGTTSFWEKLRAKIESMTPQKKTSVTTAAGGVRGAPAATEDIYWKNEATGQMVPAEELEEFKKAIRLADSADKAPARAAFSEFIKKYPESSLRGDADEAVALLGKAGKPAK